MGCGGSTSTEEPGKDGSDKYREAATPKKSPTNARETIPSPLCSPKGKDGIIKLSPRDLKKKKKIKGSPRGSPRMFPRAVKVGERAEPNETGQGTTAYTMPKKRLACKINPTDDNFSDIYSLVKGKAYLERAPPFPNSTCVTVVPEFSPRITVSLTAEESQSITTQPDGSIDFGDLTGAKVLSARLGVTPPRLRSYKFRYLTGFNKSIASVALSHDGRLCTVAMSRGKVVPTGELVVQVSPGLFQSQSKISTNARSSSAGSVHGQVKADSISRIVRCIDLRTDMLVGMLKQKGFEPEATSDMHFSYDDQHLVSCTNEGSVLLWHMGRMKIHKQLEIGMDFNGVGRLSQVTVSPNGKLVAAGGEDIDDDGMTIGQVPVWTTEGQKQIQSFAAHRAPVFSLHFHPDSIHICSGDRNGVIHIWAAETGELVHTLEGHTISVRSIHYLNSGLLLTADERFTRLWDIQDNEYTPVWTKHIDSKESIQWADDPRAQAECDEDEIDVGPLFMHPPADQSRTRQRLLITIPGGILLSAISTREVILIDAHTGNQIADIPVKSPVSCAAASNSLIVMGDIWGNVYAVDLDMV